MELYGLKSLLKRLAKADVESVIVGGYAAMSHGSALLTQDLAVACRMSEENLKKLELALEGIRPVHRQTSQKLPLDFQKDGYLRWKNLYLSTDLGQLDCLGEVAGIGDFDAVWARSEELDLGDFTTPRYSRRA